MMRVQLTTLDGCTKEMYTTYPPPPQIVLPCLPNIIEKTRWLASPIITPSRTRTYKLYSWSNFGPYNSVADYHEEWR